jgi:hypothetical protein
VAQVSAPFDAGAGAAVSEATWQKMARSWLSTGVLTGRLNQLAVTADGSALAVSVASGQAQVEGFSYENDAALAQTIATANATNPRIDTVVVRLDRAANEARLRVVEGTPAASPVAPALTQTDGLYELPLADVRVPAAAGVIVAADVTDRRAFVKNLTEAAASAAYATKADPTFSGTSTFPGGTVVGPDGAIKQRGVAGSALNVSGVGAVIAGVASTLASGLHSLQAASSVVITNAAGLVDVPFPAAFPNSLVTVLAGRGDTSQPARIYVQADGTGLASFRLYISDFAGAALANSSVRVNWMAVGS